MMVFQKIIKNEKGLHARASAKLVEVVEIYEADCEISKDNVLELYFFSILGLIFVVLVVCIMFFGSGHLLHIAFVADSCVRGRTK